MSMDVGKRDKTMSDMASIAAEAFCDKHTSPSVNQAHIRANPEMYLEHTVPYITVRTLHRLEETLKRQETALKSLEADSKWIKSFAIITGILTFVLMCLTIILAMYAWRLDTVIHSLQSNASATPSPPTPAATTTP